ncbi:DUF928 domain-containing protein [Oscillatoria sp. FACHB-1407]|uniref:DUF928 domain-containing protein n=1 Tax=Oscillatoria sp. FACHB-1407 TaxID=2692847 RepID=UPI00168703B1|nr:DUF928 domain-containing protein [Oscillatoria sp. FACHB-1407]MBD2463185.1 DUF928 domain-containing protein [Oscillatoria sp. FACHB-1407]
MIGFDQLRYLTHLLKTAKYSLKAGGLAWFLAVLLIAPSVLAQIELPTLIASGWGVPSGNRRGGGQRAGSCPNVNIPLTALVPLQDDNGTLVAQGSTASDHPTLWFYVPYTIGDAMTASLWLEEPEPGSDPSADRIYYTQREILSLPPTPPGIVSIQLPRSEPALTVGNTYRWLLVVTCDASDASSNKVAEVELSRIASDSTVSVGNTASLESRLNAYRQARLWSEFITALGTAYCQSSSRPLNTNSVVATEWSQTLQEIGLEAIATQSDVTCSAR